MRPLPAGLGAGVEPRVRVSLQLRDYQSPPPLRRGNAVRRARAGLATRLLKPLVGALLLVTAPAAAAAWLMTSPRFAVRELAIVTGERVPEAWVRAALAPVVGENLPRLPLARADQILRAHPWVLGADLRKDLPARLAVRVAVRRAVALLRDDSGLYYLDSQGARIAPRDPAAPPGLDLPLISVSARQTADLRPAIRLLSEIDDVDPGWAAELSEIEVLGAEDFRVYTSVLPFPVLVRAGTLQLKARRLDELLPHIAERFGDVSAVDLRFARRIILQPSVETGSGLARSGPARPGPAHQEDGTSRGVT